jgi:YHS domain-containing protein
MNIILKGALVSILFSLQVLAATPPIFSTEEGAIEGYDPVAYFIQGKPVKGVNTFQFEWKGAVFKFSSVENLALFEDNPDRYAPQYGGYCAYAVSEGSTASTVPEAWTIVDGKLYLNFSRGVRRLWSKDIPGRIAKADANWPGLVN